MFFLWDLYPSGSVRGSPRLGASRGGRFKELGDPGRGTLILLWMVKGYIYIYLPSGNLTVCY